MITLTLSKVHKHDKLSLTHVHASFDIKKKKKNIIQFHLLNHYFFWLIRTQHFNDDFGNLSKENILILSKPSIYLDNIHVCYT